MGYSHKNSKGVTYHLHSREGKGGSKLFFFSKDPNGSIDLPPNMTAMEVHSGMLVVKKKQ